MKWKKDASNWAQIGMEKRPRKSALLLQEQYRCFRRSSIRTPDGPETGFGIDECWALGGLNSNQEVTVRMNSNRGDYCSL